VANILVTDDSPVERRLAAALLAHQEDWSVVEAGSAEQALMLAQLTPLDLVLTDVCMPDVDGLLLLNQMKADHPLLPVIIMTGVGNEEMAVQALQSGADGYITKRRLAHDLVGVVHRVLTAAHEHRVRESVLNLRTRESISFEIGNDPSQVPSLVRHIVDRCCSFEVTSERERVRVAVALEEALVNAVIHGNLEVGSELRESTNGAYERLIAERRRGRQYAERRVYVHCDLSQQSATIVIRDEGPGFDVSRIPDPRDPERMMLASGRGVLLMRTFMDDVQYNSTGNQVTLVKRRAAGDAATPERPRPELAECC
jgi:CheY-like chemotaxis protein/anti-sigma regulatory factor (Ser/Thr protein kinase)